MDTFVINKSNIENIPDKLMENFKHKEFKNPEKCKEHCFSYLMLDRILKTVYKLKDTNIEFTNGKPRLKNNEKYFCISHSGEYTVICFSDHECGIDIEQIKTRNYKAIAKRMKFKCNSPEEFYSQWTKYEAVYKLNQTAKSIKQLSFDNYFMTMVSSNPSEVFEIYIQNGNQFPNAAK